MEGNMEFSDNKKEMYEEVVMQLKGLFEDCPHVLANLANASAVLNQALKNINWVGFYLCESTSQAGMFTSQLGDACDHDKTAEWVSHGLQEDSMLILGPFQGKPACVEIRIGKGVCGTAAARDEVTLVKNVHEFPGHIACDAASQSEIVLPIHANGKVIGVLDIDSPKLARFDEEDKAGLEAVVKVIEEMYQNVLFKAND